MEELPIFLVIAGKGLIFGVLFPKGMFGTFAIFDFKTRFMFAQ